MVLDCENLQNKYCCLQWYLLEKEANFEYPFELCDCKSYAGLEINFFTQEPAGD